MHTAVLQSMLYNMAELFSINCINLIYFWHQLQLKWVSQPYDANQFALLPVTCKTLHRFTYTFKLIRAPGRYFLKLKYYLATQ